MTRFALNFSFAKKELAKSRADIKKQCFKKFYIHNFKKLEFRDKGQDERSILNKLKAMYFI